ncbi:alpha/beta fold hydrolase [Streptomyces sp. UG1]|uniref:alpha/beta fold hydrolase n=1 Tax=Streptomyces sp. UG1 TaxID=3417652 RepID=UPI003CF83ADE
MPSAVRARARALPGYPGPRHWRQVPVTGQHYVDVGAGDPVLLLHGNPSWSYLWRGLLGTLSPDFRCVAPDLPGLGLSPRCPEPLRSVDRLERHLACLDQLVDRIAAGQERPARRWTLVVHDWGGLIGLAWTLRHPQKVGRLVVLNSVAFPWPAGHRLPAHLRWIRGSAPVAALALATNAFPRAALRRGVVRRLGAAERMAYLLPFADAHHRRTAVELVRNLPRDAHDPVWRLLVGLEDLDADRGLAGLPVFIGWGMRDALFTPTVLDEWIRRFPQARVRRYRDAGHLVMEDAAGELDRHVRDFLLGT